MQISYQNKLKENKVRGETEKEIRDITILKVQTGGQFRGEKKTTTWKLHFIFWYFLHK